MLKSIIVIGIENNGATENGNQIKRAEIEVYGIGVHYKIWTCRLEL